MTACTNKGGKAGRVITAALVATLSVGAPVVALATTADGGAGDVQLMAATEADAFMAGKVSEYKVGDKTVEGNAAATIKKGDLKEDAEACKIEITKVTPDGAGAEAVKTEGKATTEYFKKVAKNDAAYQINGAYYTEVTSWTDINAAGEYVAVSVYTGKDLVAITPDKTVNNVAPAVSFTVTADSLEGAKLMKNVAAEGEDPEYTDEITYAYGQKWGDLKVIIDDVDVTSQVTIAVYEKGTAGDDVSASGIVPGTYEVVVKGTDNGVYQGSETKLEVSVAKLDLSTLDLYIGDVTDGKAPTIASVKGDGVAVVGQNNLKALSFSETDKTWGSNGAGEYTATLSVPADKSDLSARFTGTATIKYNRLAKNAKAVTWKYAGIDQDLAQIQAAIESGATVTIDPSAKEVTTGMNIVLNGVDPTKLSGTYKVDDEDTKLTAGQFSVKVVDADGNEVTDLASLKKGKYTLKVEAVPSALEYKVSRSTVSIDFTYQLGTVAEAGTTFTYDGKVVEGTIPNLTYDGTDKLDKLGVQVKSGDKTLVEGTDYTVKVTKKVDNKDVEVTEAVDAGTYKVTVSSDTYKIDDTLDNTETIEFTVAQVSLAGAKVEFPTAITYSTVVYNTTEQKYETVEKTFVPYTGEAITPVVKVALTKDADGKDVWTELDASNYELSFEYRKGEDGAFESVKEVKEAGFYAVKVTASKDNANFKDALEFNENKPFEVANKKVFIDVDSSAWYAQSVYTAVEQGYINGMNNSNVFAPEASINRADVVVVLYRMAGGTNVGADDSVNVDQSYLSKFSDVQGNEYYANALAWASKAGVVTGYEDGTFGPADPVTAEQFATMLARYAKLTGIDTSVEDVDAVLGEVADGDQVSGFAREAVAWAVESGYLAQGSDIVPQSDVSRGRMITIAVRFQPEQIDVIA